MKTKAFRWLGLPFVAMLLMPAASAMEQKSAYVQSVSQAMRDASGHVAKNVWSSMGQQLDAPSPLGSSTGWGPLGPPGGDVVDVKASPVDPDIVLAGVAPTNGLGGALYRSEDGAASWTKVQVLSDVDVHAVVFTDEGKAYVGTESGVWVSHDAGLVWSALAMGIGPNNRVLSLAIDPTDPDVVWAGIAEGFGSQPINLMRSIDGGITWMNATPPIGVPMNGDSVAIDPNDGDVVMATFSGTLGGGAVWLTMDGGTTWIDRSAGLPGNPMRASAFNGKRLLVGGGQLFGSQYVGLYESSDLGASWTALHDDTWPLLIVTDIAVDPLDPDVILTSIDGGGVNRSVDAGATWEIAVDGSDNLAVQSVAFLPGSSSNVLLGVSSLGVYASSDGGQSFQASANGLSELSLYSIHVNPNDQSEIAAAFQGENSGGVLTSVDNGKTWRLEPLPATRYKRVRFSPEGTLYALSTGPITVGAEGLYRRSAEGSWNNLGPDQGSRFESELGVIRFSVNDVNKIWLGGNDFGVAGFEQTVWFTDDGGASWTKRYEGPSNKTTTGIEIVEDQTDSRMLAVYDDLSGSNSGGVLLSDDGGVTWKDGGIGLPAFVMNPRICASPVDPQNFYVSLWADANLGRVFRTNDAATSPWIPTAWRGTGITGLLCDAIDSSVLYIAHFLTPRVMRSDDRGEIFVPFDAGLQGSGDARELAQLPDGSGLLLATGKGSFRIVSDGVIFANGFEGTGRP